ncbi:unnamed protein product [Rotaria sp. Silwood2]|nr:unnamed protein product [Rotaria sp. Silwood2]CAF4499126.1 unnamed protein product [Rotaria sp. Silwood2]
MSEALDGIDGNWKIIDYPPHPECVGCEFKISNESPNKYRLYAHVVNGMNCTLEYNPENNEWKTSPLMSTLMAGPPEKMKKESFISDLISHINFVQTEDEQYLIIQTNDSATARLERI